MSYEQFAYLYDELMKDVPYDKWVEIIEQKAAEYHVAGKKLLDLACGTGELSVRLAGSGYDVTGVDLSEDMLSVAKGKSDEQSLPIQYFQQNMAELEGLGLFDIIGIFCDSLNYLQNEEDVKRTFEGVFTHLKDDGLFIADVHSVYKMAHIFMNQTFALNEEEISYIWESFEGEHPHSVEHELTFFALDEATGKYDRYDELHFQRTYPVEQYRTWLNQAGFEVLDVLADFSDTPPQDDSERIFFICRKHMKK